MQTLQNFCNKAHIRIHFFFFFSHEKFLKRLVCLPSFLCSVQYLFNLLTLSYMITFLHCIKLNTVVFTLAILLLESLRYN